VFNLKVIYSGYQNQPKPILRNMRFAAFDGGQIFEFRIKKGGISLMAAFPPHELFRG